MKFISLKYKLLYSSIVISFLLTLFMSIIAVNRDLNSYETVLRNELLNFEKANKEYLTSALWAMEYDSLKAFAVNEASGNWITWVSITDIRGNSIASAGKKPRKNALTRTMNLNYFHNNRDYLIGTVQYGGSLPDIHETIHNNWKTLFLLNGFFVVVIFLLSYLLVYKNILSRLLNIIKTISRSDLACEHISDINGGSAKHLDEINILIDALNNRANRINNEFSKRLAAEADLENNNTLLNMEIEERRSLEQELKESEKKYRNFLESTSTVPWEISLENNEFTFMGKQIETILGYPAESWKDINTWKERLHPDDREEAASYCELETLKGNDHDFSYRAIHKDGSHRWIRDIVSVIMENNTPRKLIGFMHDITVQMNLSLEKDRLESQLRQAQKMEAIGTLAGGIAHDFNNILTAMLGYSEIARDQLAPDDPVRKDLEQVLAAGNRAADLVAQILTFSRQGEKKQKPLSLQTTLKEVLQLLRSSMPTTIRLSENIDPACGMILADPTQIHQVLMNLCTNAIHAIGDEFGTLSVSLVEIEITDTNSIEDCPQILQGTYLDLEISDNGCGMSESVQSQIFNPFFTTKEVGKGTGLGLAVAHGIIKQHKGEITVRSVLGQGTTFHVYLPVISEQLRPDKQALHRDIPLGSGERILFVDDEETIATVMQRSLATLGYEITVFTSSPEALEAFRSSPELFDLVITDMTMPEMTGTDLAVEMLAIRPDIPIILCTGFSEAIDERTAESFGICEYVSKPADRQALAKAIKSALSSRE